MNYSDYYVVPAAERAALGKLFEPHTLIDDGKYVIVVSGDEKSAKKLGVAMHFHNDEWSAWGFTLYVKGKAILDGLFGENEESGVSPEDNFLDGDLNQAATVFGVDAAKLRKVVEADEPDVEKFIALVGFGLYPVTPQDLPSAPPKDEQNATSAKKKAVTPKKVAKKNTAPKKKAIQKKKAPKSKGASAKKAK